MTKSQFILVVIVGGGIGFILNDIISYIEPILTCIKENR